MSAKPFGAVPAPNMANPGAPFGPNSLAPGIKRPNLLRLGTMFRAVTDTAIVNPVNVPSTDGRVFRRVTGSLNMAMSGVSRDNAGAVLGNCTVMIFTTQDKRLVAETTSDGSGAWSVPLMVGGPFFIVEYKVGSPDVAGTSLNTLTPAGV